MLEVVLVNPEIPQNTGSIARLCAGVGAKLHLVGKIGFCLDDKHLRRAGLDYWSDVFVRIHPDFDSVLRYANGRPFYLFSKRAEIRYCDVKYTGDELLVFGSESSGIPEHILKKYWNRCLRIPISNKIRSLNLSGAVHIAVYHVLEKLGFPGLP